MLEPVVDAGAAQVFTEQPDPRGIDLRLNVSRRLPVLGEVGRGQPRREPPFAERARTPFQPVLELKRLALSVPVEVWWQLAHALTFVALGTALRRGELLALRWRDVQLLDGTLQVREAFVRGRITTPKSNASKRLIELGPRTRDLLAQHWQRTSFQGDDELVFCHPHKGTPLDPSKLARCYLRPALARAGAPSTFRAFHDLRHTALTHEAAAGNPLSYVQHKAGHAQAAITERYIHTAQVHFPGAAAKGEARMFDVAANSD